MLIKSSKLTLKLTDDLTRLESLTSGERELLASAQKPLFTVRTRDSKGDAKLFPADEAKISQDGDKLVYDFGEISVALEIKGGDTLEFGFSVDSRELIAEYIDLANVSFVGALRESGGDCAVVSTYNEGMLVENSKAKRGMVDPEYPSQGGYMMYPYMLSAPIQMWLYGNEGILMTVVDPELGPKGLDFASTDDSCEFRTRIFLGNGTGESIKLIWETFEGSWQNGAQLYRARIADRLATLAKAKLPEWYTHDMPLVITYPVRGMHDTDVMNPNKLFPYHNILPTVEELAEKTGCRIMVLLMHWEGTAPWAPPYVWPPYGGAELFRDFMSKLHESGNLLGVYCSGLGFTEQSNLVAEYENKARIENENLKKGFCAAPDGSVPNSNICRAQRSGYDICPANELGKKLLDDALEPLLTSGVDYVQALDQNHGGGMYFCYSKEHGHPAAPGGWMTKASRELLAGWKELCPNTLLGCESAAAEPYVGELRLSDNRYELCYSYGQPIPLYAYLYHSVLHNFMGNQVSAPVERTSENIRLRIAYSFTAGDLITLILNDEKQICYQWGGQWGSTDEREPIIAFCAHLAMWHRKLPELFRDAEMTLPLEFECDKVDVKIDNGQIRKLNSVMSSFWRLGGERVGLFVNYTSEPREVKLASEAKIVTLDGESRGKSFTLAPMTAASVVE